MAQCEPINPKKLWFLQFFSVEALLKTSAPFLHCPKLPRNKLNMDTIVLLFSVICCNKGVI